MIKTMNNEQQDEVNKDIQYYLQFTFNTIMFLSFIDIANGFKI
jgi:hypothetical protein